MKTALIALALFAVQTSVVAQASPRSEKNRSMVQFFRTLEQKDHWFGAGVTRDFSNGVVSMEREFESSIVVDIGKNSRTWDFSIDNWFPSTNRTETTNGTFVVKGDDLYLESAGGKVNVLTATNSKIYFEYERTYDGQTYDVKVVLKLSGTRKLETYTMFSQGNTIVSEEQSIYDGIE